MNKLRSYKYHCVIFNTISSESRVYWKRNNVFSKDRTPHSQLSNVEYQGLRLCHSETQNMEHKSKETILIAGLGNHDHPKTRHSVGMQLVDRLGEFLGIKITKKKECLGFVGSRELRHIHIVLLKPKLPMNINGTSVHKTAKFYNVPTANIYLIHDELGKAVGKTGVKEAGSAGGHNGVKSVIQSFRTDSIKRIKIGIDRPTSIDLVPDYVLQRFDSSELPMIDNAINQGILKLAKHVGSKTGLTTSLVFSVNENLEND